MRRLDNHIALASFPRESVAVVIGASGALGSALRQHLLHVEAFTHVIGICRTVAPTLDLGSEESIAAAARLLSNYQAPVRLVIDATGFLHGAGVMPEKSWRELDAAHLSKSFAINAIGPALLMKHLLPLLPREGKSVFATLSAKVGSIGDNRLGGWYGYRASKAALNQFVRTAAIELRRRQPEAICVALHPGTVESALSRPFGKAGLEVRSPDAAAALLLDVIDRLTPAASGGFLDYRGEALPW